MKEQNKADIKSENMTRDQLWELERSGRSTKENVYEFVISLLPFAGLAVSLAEYCLIPNKYNNAFPHRYIVFLLIPMTVYLINWIIGLVRYMAGNRQKMT